MNWKIKHYILSLRGFKEDKTQNATCDYSIYTNKAITKDKYKQIEKILKG